MEKKVEPDLSAETVSLLEASGGLLERSARSLPAEGTLDEATLGTYRCDPRTPGAERGMATAG